MEIGLPRPGGVRRGHLLKDWKFCPLLSSSENVECILVGARVGGQCQALC